MAHDSPGSFFPQTPEKADLPAHFSPADFLTYRRSLGKLAGVKPPTGAIICFSRRLFEHACQKHPATKVADWGGDLRLFDQCAGSVGIVGNFGVGAPVAVTELEELIALGVRQFVVIGTAGGLSPALKVGELVVCDRAIRDEGTSFHYLPASRYAFPDPSLTARLTACIQETGLPPHVGTSWTIDAPYRETRAEIQQYQQEGVLTVEMEASALFAVAAYRKVEIAAAFTISDYVAADPWQPHFHAEATRQGLDALLGCALAVLKKT